MIELQLTKEQELVLKEILEMDLMDLRMEIGGTDSRKFRGLLKEKKKVLEKTLMAFA